MSFLYIASPYTHDDPAVLQRRFEKAVDFTSYLTNKGMYVFSPIVHSHPLCTLSKMPVPFEFWIGFDEAMIYVSRGIILFQIDGWEESRGMQAELKYASQIGKPVMYSKVDFAGYDHAI